MVTLTEKVNVRCAAYSECPEGAANSSIILLPKLKTYITDSLKYTNKRGV